jgi:hypothetical protein
MKNTTQRFRNGLLALVNGLMIFYVPIFANAACNDANNWFVPPGPDIEVILGYEQEDRSNFDEMNVVQSSKYYAYPPPLPSDIASPGALSGTETSTISYYEPNGKGSWRVCRRETWWPPRDRTDEGRKELRRTTIKYASGNRTLASIPTEHIARHATLYFYDKKGRISRIEEGDFEYPERRPVIRICKKYDEKDRLVLLLNPQTSQSCSANPPDTRDAWGRLQDGEDKGEGVEIFDEWHHGDAEGNWSKSFGRFTSGLTPDAVSGAAKAKSSKGVTIIYGSNAGKLDDNSGNTVVDSFGSWNGSTYYFTKPPVPLDVLEHPELIYKYERRRQTLIDGIHFRLYELFKPNEHISHHRYYYQGGMLRNEQVDAKGRVSRVITVNDYRQPRPGPHPDVDDKLLTDKGLRIFGHQIYHRVYDLDPKGNPTLVAASWNRKLRLNPLKKTHIDFAEVVYGTPDGKVKWNKLADFEKAFGFTSNAAEVFPDRSENPADDDDD